MKFDLTITNGRVIDPETGTDDFLNVGVKNGKIAAISREELKGKQVVDALGCIVAPGFIDIHCHEDSGGINSAPIETAKTLMRAGVTTMVGGNCGGSPYPIGSYLARVNEIRLPINYVMLAGYNSLREQLGIDKYRAATDFELEQLKKMADSALQEGAVGISLGLQYAPGVSTKEAIEMGKIVAQHNGFIAVHLRYDYPRSALEGLKEMGKVAAKSKVRVQISHIAANIYKMHQNKRNIQEALNLIERWSEQGLKVKADTYPYNAWGGSVKSTIFDENYYREYTFTYEDCEILAGPLSGQRLSEELFNQLRKQERDTKVACHNAMPMEDVKEALKHPFVCVGSDGSVSFDVATGKYSGHPRCAGTTAKFLQMVREEGLVDLVTAIRKLTFDPAVMINLPSKGRLQEEKDADITVFNFDTISDQSRFGNNVCVLPSEGICHVIYAGKVVYGGQDAEHFVARLQ